MENEQIKKLWQQIKRLRKENIYEDTMEWKDQKGHKSDIQLEEINQKSLVKEGRQKDIQIGSGNTDKICLSKITKGNSINKMLENDKDRSIAGCQGNKTMFVKDIGREKSISRKAEWITNMKKGL